MEDLENGFQDMDVSSNSSYHNFDSSYSQSQLLGQSLLQYDISNNHLFSPSSFMNHQDDQQLMRDQMRERQMIGRSGEEEEEEEGKRMGMGGKKHKRRPILDSYDYYHQEDDEEEGKGGGVDGSGSGDGSSSRSGRNRRVSTIDRGQSRFYSGIAKWWVRIDEVYLKPYLGGREATDDRRDIIEQYQTEQNIYDGFSQSFSSPVTLYFFDWGVF